MTADQGPGRHFRLGVRIGGGNRGALGIAVVIEPSFRDALAFY
jgi:hypothetical protein